MLERGAIGKIRYRKRRNTIAAEPGTQDLMKAAMLRDRKNSPVRGDP
jgi:hypothetical protein